MPHPFVHTLHDYRLIVLLTAQDTLEAHQVMLTALGEEHQPDA